EEGGLAAIGEPSSQGRNVDGFVHRHALPRWIGESRARLRRVKHPGVAVLGTDFQVLPPGFVNAHHHIGLTPVQRSPDIPLDLWFATRLVMRRVDLYLDTLYSPFEIIASGITTVQHLHGWVPGDLAAVEAGAGEVIRAYEDIGMRVSYSFAFRDQNRLVY